MPVVCKHCSTIFSKQSNLNRHLKHVHKIEHVNMISYHYDIFMHKCLNGCEVSFKFNFELRHHLKSVHGMEMEEDVFEFSTKEEFSFWLSRVPEIYKAEYTVARVNKQRLAENDAVETVYLNCNRSGIYNGKSEVRKRSLKSQGSMKLNHACTSQIIVTKKPNDHHTVNFYKTHYGHEFDLQHLHVPLKDRSNIAAKLNNGVPVTRILDSYRGSIGSELKREDLLTRRDVLNIKAAYSININDGVRHQSDAVSVDLWVQECVKLEYNPILFYKRQGDNHEKLQINDFLLIMMNHSQEEMFKKFGSDIVAIDSTHGLNNYDFELTTLMVVDEFGEGFPVACLFSNRKDTFIFQIFFEAIRTKVGIITPNTFMSDIAPVFYNAWVNVHGPAKNQLFCSWHIDRAWQINLNKVKDIDKRKWVYKTLKCLQQAMDESSFHEKLERAQAMMEEDNDTKDFAMYFRNNYFNNCKQWAYCYRKGCGINTNMYLESMHKVVKYLYLDAKKTKRLDKGINAVMKYVRDKIIDRMIKLTKGKNTVHQSEINARHRLAATDAFTSMVSEQSEHTWIVKSGDNEYLVAQNRDSHSCCQLKCTLCNVCVNCFRCTCVDYCIKATICKHIHYIVISDSVKRTNNDIISPLTEISDHLVTLSTSAGNPRCNDSLRDKILSETAQLQSSVQTVTDTEILSQVLKTLRTVNNLMTNGSSLRGSEEFHTNSANNEPDSKKIEKQIRFHSTQKKNAKVKYREVKPTSEEVKVISSFLEGKDVEFVSNSSQNDHLYH